MKFFTLVFCIPIPDTFPRCSFCILPPKHQSGRFPLYNECTHLHVTKITRITILCICIFSFCTLIFYLKYSEYLNIHILYSFTLFLLSVLKLVRRHWFADSSATIFVAAIHFAYTTINTHISTTLQINHLSLFQRELLKIEVDTAELDSEYLSF